MFDIIFILVGTKILYHRLDYGKFVSEKTVFAWNQLRMMLHVAICCHFDPNCRQDKDTLNVTAQESQ